MRSFVAWVVTSLVGAVLVPGVAAASAPGCETTADCECLWGTDLLATGTWKVTLAPGVAVSSRGDATTMLPKGNRVEVTHDSCGGSITFSYKDEQGKKIDWKLSPVEAGNAPADWKDHVARSPELEGDDPGRIYFASLAYPMKGYGSVPATMVLRFQGEMMSQGRRGTGFWQLHSGPVMVDGLGPMWLWMSTPQVTFELVGKGDFEKLSDKRRKVCRCERVNSELAGQRNNLAAYEKALAEAKKQYALERERFRLAEDKVNFKWQMRAGLSDVRDPADGKLFETPVFNPDFKEGEDPSAANWPCLEVYPLDGDDLSIKKLVKKRLGKEGEDWVGGRTDLDSGEHMVKDKQDVCELPEIIYDSRKVHEEHHSKTCKKRNATRDRLAMQVSSSFSALSLRCLACEGLLEHPVLYAEEEIASYKLTIDTLQGFIDSYCPAE